jgi:predicted Zn finger-like uncharacterized protein
MLIGDGSPRCFDTVRSRINLGFFLGMRVNPNGGIFKLPRSKYNSNMTKLQSPPFKCPNCEALYQVERIEAANDREIRCRDCGGPLRAREGQYALKYFLLRRSGEFRRPGYSVV